MYVKGYEILYTLSVQQVNHEYAYEYSITQGKVGVYRNRLNATEGALKNGKKIKNKIGES